MSKNFVITLLAWLWLPISSWTAEIPVVILDEDIKIVEAEGNFIYCLSEEGEICPDEAYQILSRNVLSNGFIESNVTLLTRLVNSMDLEQDLKLELANPSLNNVRVEIISGSDTLYREHFSDQKPFYKRNFFHRNYILPFSLKAFEQADIRITIMRQRESIFLPIRICTEKHFLKSSGVEYLLLGGIIGMYTIYIIFILGLFLLWRSKLFLYYALINLFVLMYCIFDTGYGFQFLWPEFPVFQRFIVPVVAFSYLMGLISFTREFFSTPIKYPGMDRVLVSYMGINITIFTGVMVMYNVVGMSLIIPLLLLVGMFLLFGLTVSSLGAITYMQSGRREGFWFLFLFSLYLVMFAFILNQKGYFGFFIVPPDSVLYYHLPVFTSTPHYIFVMMLAEMLIVSAVIAFRFQDVLEEYNVTQRRIEDVNRNSIKAFIKGQEVERESLAVRLDRNIGVDLSSIEEGINTILSVEPENDAMKSSLGQLHDVQEDLRRIASDFVVDWGNVELQELISRVFNELKTVLPDVRIIVDIDKYIDNLEVSDLIRLNLYRILQEACNNIIKHANAEEVHASFDLVDDCLDIIIDDDGIGFDIDKIVLKRGIGLRNIETRVNALNGSIQITAMPGVGTKIQMNIPVEKNVGAT